GLARSQEAHAGGSRQPPDRSHRRSRAPPRAALPQRRSRAKAGRPLRRKAHARRIGSDMHRHRGRRLQSAPNAWAASSLRAARNWDWRRLPPRLLTDRPPKETGRDIRRRAFNLHTRGQFGKDLPADARTAGSAQPIASAATAVMPNGAKLARVAATEPSTSMPRQASSITTTAKPSRRASSAE